MTTLLLRHVLESPLPLTAFLLLVTGLLVWMGLARDDRRLLRWSALPAGLAGLVLLLGWLVTTPAEHGEATIRRLVAAAERAEIDPPGGMLGLIAPDATLNFGREEAPAISIDGLAAAFRTLAGRHRIRDNTVTRLRGETLDRDRARVELGCRTTTDSSMGGPAITRWVFEVRRDPADPDRWRVQRVTFLTLGGRPADAGILR
jgi:hypothetical protein